ncbi:MAG TPA: AAA family ATPase, partial [Pirellulaceae bacterium]|nr:AAA family ATPase [Pirellulaceae bacterium]
ISSFLFIGPTGVGKTEMAKAIAEFMYGDPNRLIRIDMSEYNAPHSASRLIGGFGSGDGVLTSKVREQPFTVLLLDEFEKADPAVFDVLLQVLGEGRLTDGRGQNADFTTSIIVLTSNLGVESFREQALGFSEGEQPTWRAHFTQQLEKFVRPEFFNRIDKIVPFAPLSREAMLLITQRELKELQKRPGIVNRRISLEFEQSAIEQLANSGHETRYGARPLKRAITRNLVRPMAAKLNNIPVEVPLVVHVAGQASGLHVQIEKDDDVAKPSSSRHGLSSSMETLALQRRRAQALANCPGTLRIHNKIFRLEQLIEDKTKKLQINDEATKRRRRQIKLSVDQHESELRQLRKVIDEIGDLQNRVLNYEQEVLLKLLKHQDILWEDLSRQTKRIENQIFEQILSLFLSEQPAIELVHLIMFSRSHKNMQFLLDGYLKFCEQRSFTLGLYSMHRYNKTARDVKLTLSTLGDSAGSGSKPQPTVDLKIHVADEAMFGHKDQIGCVLSARGKLAYHMLALERGVHRFNSVDHESVLVAIFGGQLSEYVVPAELDKLPLFTAGPIRRRYDFREATMNDEVLKKRVRDIQNWEVEIGSSIEEAFSQHLNNFVNLWT